MRLGAVGVAQYLQPRLTSAGSARGRLAPRTDGIASAEPGLLLVKTERDGNGKCAPSPIKPARGNRCGAGWKEVHCSVDYPRMPQSILRVVLDNTREHNLGMGPGRFKIGVGTARPQQLVVKLEIH